MTPSEASVARAWQRVYSPLVPPLLWTAAPGLGPGLCEGIAGYWALNSGKIRTG